MRSFVLVGAAAALACAAMASVAPAATKPSRVSCPGGAITVLFWPDGHGAIPSVGFPEFSVPHIEVYKTGARYPNANFRGFVGPGGGQFSKTCRSVSGSAAPTKVKSSAKITETFAVKCRFRSPAVNVERVDRGQRSTLRIFAGTDLYLAAQVNQTGASLSYNTKLCTTAAAPA